MSSLRITELAFELFIEFFFVFARKSWGPVCKLPVEMFYYINPELEATQLNDEKVWKNACE